MIKKEKIVELEGEAILSDKVSIMGNWDFPIQVKFSQIIQKILPELRKEYENEAFDKDYTEDFLDYLKEKYGKKSTKNL